MRLVRFGEYEFPEEQIELSDNFRDLVQRTIRLPGMSGGFRVYGDNSSPSEVGNVRTSFWLEPTHPNGLQAMVDAVGKLRTYGLQRLYVRERNSTNERWCNAEVSNIQISENVRDMPHLRQRVQINFQTDDPFWYTLGQEAIAWGDLLWGDDVWGGGGVSNAVSGAATSFTITNNGNAETFPRILIKTSGVQTAQNVRIQRLVKGVPADEVLYNATLAISSNLEINCRAAAVRLNNVNAYGNSFFFLTSNFFRLLPGANSIRVLMGDSGSAATVLFYYYERYT
jgi:phage-related protein